MVNTAGVDSDTFIGEVVTVPEVQLKDTGTVALLSGLKFLLTVIVAGARQGSGTAIVVFAVVTVEPNARARPIRVEVSPKVMLRPSPVPRKMVPRKLLLAPTVVAPSGAQNTLSTQAPSATTTFELAPESSAPPERKIWTPLPLSVTVVLAVMLIAPVLE